MDDELRASFSIALQIHQRFPTYYSCMNAFEKFHSFLDQGKFQEKIAPSMENECKIFRYN